MRENNFDLLRVIAALQVMIMHTTAHILLEHDYTLNTFWTFIIEILSYIEGVPIFFLISGFLITMSYERNSNIKNYIQNRVLRIFPGLYVNIFLGVIILYYFGYLQFNLEFFSWLMAQLTIVQFYNAEMFRGFGVGVINGSLWTISVELSFYILLPLLFLVLKKQKVFFIIIGLVSFIIWNYDFNSAKDVFINKLIHVSILPYIFLFIIGICFYKFFDNVKSYIENKFGVWSIAFIIFNIIVYYFSLENNYFINILKWFIFSFFIFSFVFSFKNLSYRILHGNDYTYGIYISYVNNKYFSSFKSCVRD
ncbi:acyltransferase family protein [Aliarcobacter butzleri]|uniref:acyltransferase family protein n=1 Tax=Aliarcobacter butzleri TaxID=28197 RepID=UPI00126117F6|nr:acyltransferase [Aliarcobacter butzleri]